MAETTTVRGEVGVSVPGALTGEQALRLSRGGGLVTNERGKYYEMAKSGQLFHACTPDEGVAPGTDQASTTAPACLYNPAASGKDLVILNGRMAYVSGTLGAGEVYWMANTNVAAAATTGTDMTVVRGYMSASGANAAGQAARALSSATLPAAASRARVFGSLDARLATTAGVGEAVLEDNVDGAMIVPPGGTVSIMADAAAGTSPLVAISITWLETPV